MTPQSFIVFGILILSGVLIMDAGFVVYRRLRGSPELHFLAILGVGTLVAHTLEFIGLVALAITAATNGLGLANVVPIWLPLVVILPAAIVKAAIWTRTKWKLTRILNGSGGGRDAVRAMTEHSDKKQAALAVSTQHEADKQQERSNDNISQH